MTYVATCNSHAGTQLQRPRCQRPGSTVRHDATTTPIASATLPIICPKGLRWGAWGGHRHRRHGGFIPGHTINTTVSVQAAAPPTVASLLPASASDFASLPLDLYHRLLMLCHPAHALPSLGTASCYRCTPRGALPCSERPNYNVHLCAATIGHADAISNTPFSIRRRSPRGGAPSCSICPPSQPGSTPPAAASKEGESLPPCSTAGGGVLLSAAAPPSHVAGARGGGIMSRRLLARASAKRNAHHTFEPHSPQSS